MWTLPPVVVGSCQCGDSDRKCILSYSIITLTLESEATNFIRSSVHIGNYFFLIHPFVPYILIVQRFCPKAQKLVSMSPNSGQPRVKCLSKSPASTACESIINSDTPIL